MRTLSYTTGLTFALRIMLFEPLAVVIEFPHPLKRYDARPPMLARRKFPLKTLERGRAQASGPVVWKMASGSVVFIAVVPHPPIMVPEVGGELISEVRGSIEAMRSLTERLVACRAETVVIISPHAPLDARAFVAYAETQLRGDFARFRAPRAAVDVALDGEMLAAITRAAADDGFAVTPLEGYEMDHGTAVPLYFLRRFGWDGRVVSLGYSFLPNEDHVRFGGCIRRAAETVGRKVAFVASGDLSHRLKPDAPAGFNPAAHLFDEQVVEAITSSEPFRIADIDQNLRRTAGECGYRSMLVALGVLEGSTPGCELLHYEAPFGVGYMVAQLMRATSEEAK